MKKKKKLTPRQILIRDRFLSGSDDIDQIRYDPDYLKPLKTKQPTKEKGKRK